MSIPRKYNQELENQSIDRPARQLIDYYASGANLGKIKYLGTNTIETDQNLETWVINFFDYVLVDSELKINDVQVLIGSWSGRDSLPWV